MTEEVYNKDKKSSKNSEGKGLLSWLIKHSKKIIVGVVVFAVLTSGALVGLALYNKNKNFVDPNIVAEAGDTKIYIKDLNSAVFAATGRGTPEDPGYTSSDEKLSAVYNLVDTIVIERELQKEGLSISDSELVVAAKAKYSDYDTRSISAQDAYKKYMKLSVAEKQLREKLVAWKEGYAIFCRFDRADQDDMKDNQESEQIKASHKSYAEKYCNDMKKRLEIGQTNRENENATLFKDPILGLDIWKPYKMLFGESFDKESFNPLKFQYAYDEFEQIRKMDTKAGYSIILAKDKNGIESFYAVVYLSGKGQDGGITDFDQWFSGKRDEAKAKVYEEKIK